jgi:hypothetical protein
MRFEFIGSISNAEVIAPGLGIRVRSHLDYRALLVLGRVYW